MASVAVSPGPAPLVVQAPWASGRYYTAYAPQALGATATLGVGLLRSAAFYVPSTVRLARIGAEITSAGDAGSKLRLGIFADDGTGRPGALAFDGGTIAGDSATVQELVVSQTLGPGIYWSAAAVQLVTVTQPTVRTINPGIGSAGDLGTAIPAAAGETNRFAVATGVVGALPAQFAPTALGGTAVAIFVRVA